LDAVVGCVDLSRHGSTFTRTKPRSPGGDNANGLAAGRSIQGPCSDGANWGVPRSQWISRGPWVASWCGLARRPPIRPAKNRHLIYYPKSFNSRGSGVKDATPVGSGADGDLLPSHLLPRVSRNHRPAIHPHPLRAIPPPPRSLRQPVEHKALRARSRALWRCRAEYLHTCHLRGRHSVRRYCCHGTPELAPKAERRHGQSTLGMVLCNRSRSCWSRELP
jgi:hypothetical protein